ncbi:hypothetical protein BKA67DRAFT_540016 [Truncatella angustata]|uniref:Uncharacterized protein n=1 Tax=Truncatella angustata TaxID=152316 RepID=A0A9P8UE22_9PEZI|nr:uncharacterized protein BKA67DRAFT_540016 [Truncatella angustata]KAH6648206.1 hypothetical protein BKA67DRAFT_540016 [Truncatella angustata]
MRWSLASLLALPSTFLIQFTNAHPLGEHAINGVDLSNLTQALFRRVRVGSGDGSIAAPTVTDLFLLNDGAGSCNSEEDTMNSWLEEAILLHDAVETAYEYGSLPVALLWYSFFGIQPGNGQIAQTADNVALWKNIGDHISRVSQFLAGAGLTNAQVAGENPRVFCSADAGEVVDWTQPVKDNNGNPVEVSTDPVAYLTLEDAFPPQASDPKGHAFWMSAFSGYEMDFSGAETLCPTTDENGRQRYAKTARPANAYPAITDGAVFTFGTANRHILFCPVSFSPSDGFHSYPSITQAVSDDNYPTPGLKTKEQALDRLLPVSATMYHELYHLTDDDNTKDNYYSLKDIITAARSQDATKLTANSHNPETFTFFAMAAYILLNPPEDEDIALYMASFPVDASNPFGN